MRTIPQAVLDGMDPERTINARATIRKVLPSFTFKPILNTDDDTIIDLDPQITHDVVPYGTGLLRMAVCWHAAPTSKYYIYYQYVSDVTATNWPSWTQWNETDRCSPCLSKGGGTVRLFYRDPTSGDIKYAAFNGTNFDTPVTVTTWSTSQWLTMAAPSSSRLFFEYHNTGSAIGPTNPGKIRALTLPYTGTQHWDWDGLIVHTTASWNTRVFDVCGTSTREFIYWGADDSKRVYCMTWNGYLFSDVEEILNLDVIDDFSNFVFGGANMINGRPVVTGALKRPGGAEMHVYMIGPEPPSAQYWWQTGGNKASYTLGREMYIGDQYTSGGTYYSLGDIPPFSGKMNLVGNYLVFAGIGVVYIADATIYFGVDNATLKDTITNINNINMSQSKSASTRLMMEVGVDEASALLTANSELELEVGYGGEYATFGKFGIDAVADAYDASGGESLALHARSNSVRRISDYIADANYDYWSQERQAVNPGDLTKMIRVDGDFGTDETELDIEELNVDGIVYSVARSHRGSVVKAKFKIPTGIPDVRYGFLLNYYKETVEDAAERLGKEEDEIVTGDLEYYALAIIYGTDVHSGGPGIGLYEINAGVWGTPTTWEHQFDPPNYSIPENTDHWFMASYSEGALKLWYRLDTATGWTNILETGGAYVRYFPMTRSPWFKGNVGRTGLYMRNITPYSTSFGFQSTAMIIPVTDNTVFTTPDTVVIDGEQITVGSKSSALTNVLDLQCVEAYTWPGTNQTHENTYTGPFDGYEIYCDTVGPSQVHGYYNGMALAVVDGLGKGHVFTIVDYDYDAPWQWVDTYGTYPAGDDWTKHVGDGTYGYWDDQTLRRIFVAENPRGIINETSKVSIVQALNVTARGASSTIATSHPAGQVSSYFSGSVQSAEFELYSRDLDLSQEDVIRSVGSKAGVLEFQFNKRVSNLNGYFDRTGIGSTPLFDLATDLGDYGADHNGSGCLHFRTTKVLATNEEVGVAFNYQNGVCGNAVTINNSNYLNFYALSTGYPVLLESVEIIELKDSNSGWITVAYDKGTYSVYMADRFICGFHGDDDVAGGKAGFIAKLPENSDYIAYMDWPELDRRVDNFVISIGRRASQAIEEMIGEKRIWYIDTQDGKLKAFSSHETVSGTYASGVQSSINSSDADLATRVRIEGVSTAEAIDATALAAWGNLFRLVNAYDLDEEWEVDAEAIRLVEEAAKHYNSYNFKGMLDPRLEPGDIFTYTSHSGNKTIEVDHVSIGIKVSENSAEMDMEVSGHEN